MMDVFCIVIVNFLNIFLLINISMFGLYCIEILMVFLIFSFVCFVEKE